MIKKITIDNFMAHAHTELMLGPGVTVLTGPNNTGKSAVVEALRCVATNPTPNHFLRHGAKEARVGVEMEDGTKVVWVRTKRWAMYELWHPGAEEPEKYRKLQRKVPEDIQKILRLNQVDLETSNRPVDIHIGNQRNPIFLLNRPDSDAAAFFAASTESAHLLAMQDLLKLQVRDRKREEDSLIVALGRIEKDMDRLAELPSLKMRIEAARGMETKIICLEREIPSLESVLAQSRSLNTAMRARKKAANTLDKAKIPPELEETRQLARTLALLGRASRQLETTQTVSDTLAPLAAPQPFENTELLARTVDNIAATKHHLQKVAVQKFILAKLTEPPEVKPVAQLSEFLDKYIALHYRAARLDRWTVALENIAEPPEPESDEELCSLLTRMHGLTDQIQTQKASLATLEMNLENVVDTLTDHINKLGRCPTCGQEMTAAEFLDHGDCHDT